MTLLKTIVIDGYTVTEAGPIEAARSVNFAAQYQKMIDDAQAKGDDATEDDLERLQALSLWASVGACISPRLTADNWLTLPLTTVLQLKEAAEKLNPSWFPETGEAAEKKRNVKQRKSTKG